VEDEEDRENVELEVEVEALGIEFSCAGGVLKIGSWQEDDKSDLYGESCATVDSEIAGDRFCCEMLDGSSLLQLLQLLQLPPALLILQLPISSSPPNWSW
jgi:hypothetical protein